MADERSVPPEEEEGVWCVTDGELSRQERAETFRADGIENLTLQQSLFPRDRTCLVRPADRLRGRER